MMATGTSYEFTLTIYPEDDQWVSRCEELGVSSCGESIDEALENIKEAVLLYLNTLEEVGECDRVFTERMITPLEPSQHHSAAVEPNVLRTALRVPVHA